MKAKLGISMRQELAEKIEKLVDDMEDMKVTKSELIESIVNAFFASGMEHEKTARELVLLKRKKEK